mgnify:CR=1 FL=1
MEQSNDILKYYLKAQHDAPKGERETPFERLCTALAAALLRKQEVFAPIWREHREDGTDAYRYRYGELPGHGTVIPVFTSIEEAQAARAPEVVRVRLENVIRDCMHYTDLNAVFFNGATDKIILTSALMENIYAVADGLDRKDVQTIEGADFHARGVQTPYHYLVMEGSTAAALPEDAPEDVRAMRGLLAELGILEGNRFARDGIFDSAREAARVVAGTDETEAQWRFELVDTHPLRPYYRRPGKRWEGVITLACPEVQWERRFDLRAGDVEEQLEKAAAALRDGVYGEEASAVAEHIATHGGKLECAKVIIRTEADGDHPADLASAMSLTLITDNGSRNDLPVLTADGRHGRIVPFEALADEPCPAGGGRLQIKLTHLSK